MPARQPLKIANVLVSDSWGDVSEEALERGIGGREGAMIYLAREWARMGHEVTNFVNIPVGTRVQAYEPILPGRGHPRVDDSVPPVWKTFPEKAGFYEFVPINLVGGMLSNWDWDVVVAWECPNVFENPAMKKRVKLRMCEMQVAHFGHKMAPLAAEHCHQVAALSEWHKQLMLHNGLEMDEKDVVVFPNGVDLSRYPMFEREFGRKDDMKFVYSSSPDRGLWHLLKAWPYILDWNPRAELRVGYGVDKWVQFNKWSHGRPGEMAVEIESLMKQKGIVDIGKVGQTTLSKEQKKANLWLYPLDSIQSTETGCITAVENAAAGAVIITTDADCMPSEFGEVGRIHELPFDAESFAKMAIETYEDEKLFNFHQSRGYELADERDWRLIAQSWNDHFVQHLA